LLDFTCGALLDRVIFVCFKSFITYIHRVPQALTALFIDFLCTYRVNNGFIVLNEMDNVSSRCHNVLYFLYLAFNTIHWIESFMFQMNALEAIFSKDELGGVTKTICRRVSSFLGSREGAKYEDIDQLYAIRSDIVHGRIVASEKPLENLKQLHRLQSVSLWCMEKILNDKIYLKFKEKKERNAYLATLD
jgi:hypothetical protein